MSSVPPPFSPPISANVSAEWMRTVAPQLASDICMGLAASADLAAEYHLSPAQWDYVRQHPAFLEALGAAEAALNSGDSLLERIRRKAAYALDRVGVLEMARVLSDPKATSNAKLGAYDSLVATAGLGKGSTAVGTAGIGGTLIQINVNADGATSTVSIGEAVPALEAKS